MQPHIDTESRLWYTSPMVHTHDIHNDPDVMEIKWYPSQAEVMRVFAGLQVSGWWVTKEGLMTASNSGSLVARPLKCKGATQYTGIAIWRVNPVNES